MTLALLPPAGCPLTCARAPSLQSEAGLSFSIVCFQAKWRFWLQRWRGGFLLLWNRGEHGHTFRGAVQPHAHLSYYVRAGPCLPRPDLWCVSIWARPHDPHPTQPVSTVSAVSHPYWPRLPGNIALQPRIDILLNIQSLPSALNGVHVSCNGFDVFMHTLLQFFCQSVCGWTLRTSYFFQTSHAKALF